MWGGVINFLGGQGKKKVSASLHRLQLYCFASCLESQDKIYPWCVSTVSKWRSRASKCCVSNAPFPSSVELSCILMLCSHVFVAPNAVFTKCTSEIPCIAPLWALPRLYCTGLYLPLCLGQFFPFKGKCQIPLTVFFECASTTVFSVDRCN